MQLDFMAMLLIAAIPLLFAAVARANAQQRALVGCCRKCGYDLRGSGGDCPECGAKRPPQIALAPS